MSLDSNYWEQRYIQNDIGWDMGVISPPLKYIIDNIIDKNLKILIPGCGNGWEALYLESKDFNNITVIDIAESPLNNLKNKSNKINLVKQDFFEHLNSYDLILEQTFFCALNRNLRVNYFQKMNELLNLNGILTGVLFNKEFEKDGPPFGGTLEEYRTLWSPFFIENIAQNCTISHPKRLGNEILFELVKK